MTITFSTSALADLENIKIYYTKQAVPHIGEDFVAALVKHTETLIANPSIGRIVPEFNQQYIREIIHPPFRIVYLQEKNYIQIIRVWRSERLLQLSDENN